LSRAVFPFKCSHTIPSEFRPKPNRSVCRSHSACSGTGARFFCASVALWFASPVKPCNWLKSGFCQPKRTNSGVSRRSKRWFSGYLTEHFNSRTGRKVGHSRPKKWQRSGKVRLDKGSTRQGSNHIFARFRSLIRTFPLLKFCAQSVPRSHLQPLRDLPDGQSCLLTQLGGRLHFVRIASGPPPQSLLFSTQPPQFLGHDSFARAPLTCCRMANANPTWRIRGGR